MHIRDVLGELIEVVASRFLAGPEVCGCVRVVWELWSECGAFDGRCVYV